MARLQVRGDQEDHLGVGEVRRRAVVAHPALVADAGVGAADVGVAVVAVHPPALQHPFGVAVLAGAAHVVHDLVAAALGDRRADAAADVVGCRGLPSMRSMRPVVWLTWQSSPQAASQLKQVVGTSV